MIAQNPWGADVPVSMPVPLDTSEDRIPMYGFVFTNNGLFHDISSTDLENYTTPTFAPVFDPLEEVVEGNPSAR